MIGTDVRGPDLAGDVSPRQRTPSLQERAAWGVSVQATAVSIAD
jgi:hypothetical protein